MTKEQIKHEALLEASGIELQWDKIDVDPLNFALQLENALEMLPDIESLYDKLSSGQSVSVPDKDSPLNYEQLEQYTSVVGDELYNIYIIEDIYNRFKLIQSITEMENV
jgi:hypothetical protein